MVGISETAAAVLERATGAVTEGFLDAIPRLVTGIVFVALAYVGIRIALRVVRTAFGRLYPDEGSLVADLAVVVVGLFLWFGAGLVLLKILGMEEIAASLGTAAGFLALGVSYALSSMIEDTVAGVYLLRDPDFNPGDRVAVKSIQGEVRAIELRKSRLRTDEGETVVLANSDIEGEWRRFPD